MAFLTRRGAANVTADLDKIANLFQHQGNALGIPAKIAQDFAYRCDLLADYVEKHASRMARVAAEDETGLSVEPEPDNQGFDANLIGDQTDGPIEITPPVETFMEGDFTQEKFQALRNKQQSGALADNAAKGKADAKLAAEVRRLASMVQTLQARLAGEDGESAPGKKTEEAGTPAGAKKAAKRKPLAASQKAALRRLMAEEEASEDNEGDEASKEAAIAYDLFAR